MRSIGLMVVLGAFFVIAGCGSSSDPSGTEGSAYPEIPNLVVFYAFDGNLENAVADEHHGSTERSLTYVEDHSGRANSAVHVTTEVIRVADHSDLDITGAITLAAWVKPDLSNHAYATVIDKNYTEAYSLGMHGAVDPELVFMRAYLTDSHFWTDDIVPMGLDTWSHIAFTYDEATEKGKFYMNGAAVDSMTQLVTIGVNDTDLRIGVAFYGDRYVGAIDEVAIFDRALSEEEIGQLYDF